MAKSSSPSWDDMEPVESSGSDRNEVQTIDLSPGDSVTGEVVHFLRGVGHYGADLVLMTVDGDLAVYEASAGHVKEQLRSAGPAPGDFVAFRKQEETTSFEANDGEQVEYHHVDVRTRGSDA